MTLVALLGFVLGRARASSDEARRALLHAQDRARESSRATRSRIADIDEERAQSIRMATLGERTRIAREIHDNVGHLLTDVYKRQPESSSPTTRHSGIG